MLTIPNLLRVQLRCLLSFGFAVFLACVTLATSAAHAHFDLERNVRIIHVEHTNGALRVFIRLPTPYLLAPPVAATASDTSEESSRFYDDIEEDGIVVHRLDPLALEAGATDFAALIADGHLLSIDGSALSPSFFEARIFTIDEAPSFSTLNEAKQAFSEPFAFAGLGNTLVGETLTDALIVYPLEEATRSYSFASTLNPGLAGQEATANLLADHVPGSTRIYRATGILDTPIEVTRLPFAAIFSFIYEGVIHILEGLDHVLFVVCLALGAATISGLLWRVTGFTVGHSVTLSLGFFGFAPSGAWFVPTVETGIALSIIYAAAVALFSKSETENSDRRWFLITALIGLLHGLGFSFVLHEILQVDGPDVWKSLLAFNVGVELGQVMIVLAIWPLSLVLSPLFPRGWSYLRASALLACIAISAVWSYERVASIAQAI